MSKINKPALLRQLFQIAGDYNGQIFSYHKMLGQLHDAGNTTTLAHYLDLLEGVGMVAGLEKYNGKKIRLRSSIPKLQVFNNALCTAISNYSFTQATKDLTFWGRLMESTVGAHLLNNAWKYGYSVFYWREGNYEVDYILQLGKKIIPIEVKSNYRKLTHPGTKEFCSQYKSAHTLLIGGTQLSLEDFLLSPLSKWLDFF